MPILSSIRVSIGTAAFRSAMPACTWVEEQAIRTVEEAIDTTDVVRKGAGAGIVYAYGYRCRADRLKVGFTEANTVQQIAAQTKTQGG